MISHFLYQKFNRFFLKIYKKKNEESNKKLFSKLEQIQKIPISKLISDLKLKKDFSIICIKPNDSLHANLFEYYEIKEKYSNIRSCESDFEENKTCNDIGNYRLCLESLQGLTSSTTVYQIMVRPIEV